MVSEIGNLAATERALEGSGIALHRASLGSRSVSPDETFDSVYHVDGSARWLGYGQIDLRVTEIPQEVDFPMLHTRESAAISQAGGNVSFRERLERIARAARAMLRRSEIRTWQASSDPAGELYQVNITINNSSAIRRIRNGDILTERPRRTLLGSRAMRPRQDPHQAVVNPRDFHPLPPLPPSFTVVESQLPQEDEACIICFDDGLRETDPWCKHTCGKWFHQKCAQRWRLRSQTCAHCRQL